MQKNKNKNDCQQRWNQKWRENERDPTHRNEKETRSGLLWMRSNLIQIRRQKEGKSEIGNVREKREERERLQIANCKNSLELLLCMSQKLIIILRCDCESKNSLSLSLSTISELMLNVSKKDEEDSATYTHRTIREQ